MQRFFAMLVVILALSALACNIPFLASQPEATPAPTDAGFELPTQEVDPGQAPEATEPALMETPEAGAVPPEESSEGGTVVEGDKRLTLATTDSLANTGLLDQLIGRFMEQTGYQIVLELGGAGRAFRLGEKYVADVLLVNNPGNEVTFVSEGYGRDRVRVFHADYVIVGPADDPAGVKGASDAVDAFKKIAGGSGKFVTRAVDAPEILLEKRLWGLAGITPSGEWYHTATDAGPVAVLKLASDKKAYALIDRVTFLQNLSGVSLEIVYAGDTALIDPYNVVTVNPDKSPKINYPAAQAFVEFLKSPAAQELIAQFGVETYGQPIYFADVE